jgi:hypothetical protein
LKDRNQNGGFTLNTHLEYTQRKPPAEAASTTETAEALEVAAEVDEAVGITAAAIK